MVFFLCLGAFIGDALASKFKRIAKIKDFSNFLPEHGGILDRVDSQLLCGLILYTLISLNVHIL